MIKLSGLSEEQTLEIIPERTLLLGYTGSISHGTRIAKTDPNCIDDIDILGVAVGPEEVYYGLKIFEQKETKKDEWDSVVYEIRKFFRLLLKQNPNVLSLLWLHETNYIHISESGRRILDNKDLFKSKECYHSFVGYGKSQRSRMEKDVFEGFQCAKRKKQFETFGYDCKAAQHLIRLLRMGVEYLTDGQLRVLRHDAAELKDIKTGKWSIEQVKAEADRLFILAQEAFVRSPLPPQPDYKKAEELLISILKKELK